MLMLQAMTLGRQETCPATQSRPGPALTGALAPSVTVLLRQMTFVLEPLKQTALQLHVDGRPHRPGQRASLVKESKRSGFRSPTCRREGKARRIKSICRHGQLAHRAPVSARQRRYSYAATATMLLPVRGSRCFQCPCLASDSVVVVLNLWPSMRCSAALGSIDQGGLERH